MTKNKLFIFDFCDTLVSFQTADAFVDYVRMHSGKTSVKAYYGLYLLLKWLKIIRLLTWFLPEASINKRVYLYQIRGISYAELDYLAMQFYQERIRPNLIASAVQRLQDKIINGETVWIASGGYEIYLKYFMQEYRVKKLLATNLRLKNMVSTGTIDGKDCLYSQKLKKIKKEISVRGDLYIEAYSDSSSDLPMLLYADKAIVVSKGRSQSWARRYHFEEIIY